VARICTEQCSSSAARCAVLARSVCAVVTCSPLAWYSRVTKRLSSELLFAAVVGAGFTRFSRFPERVIDQICSTFIA